MDIGRQLGSLAQRKLWTGVTNQQQDQDLQLEPTSLVLPWPLPCQQLPLLNSASGVRCVQSPHPGQASALVCQRECSFLWDWVVQGWEPGYCQTDQDESGTLFSGWVTLDKVFNLSELSVPLSSCCTEGILGNKEKRLCSPPAPARRWGIVGRTGSDSSVDPRSLAEHREQTLRHRLVRQHPGRSISPLNHVGWLAAPLAEPICHFYYKLPLNWLNPKPVTPKT